MSLTQLQDIPLKNVVFLVGPPGAGKSTFCEQVILQNLTIDKPIIYAITEYGPSNAEKILKEKGLGDIRADLLYYIDAYNETVGLSVLDRPDIVSADCGNLSSIGIAISKLQNRIQKNGVLLVFDSLTSPYLLSGSEVVRFLKLTISRFAAEGNSALICFDEGSSKEEDLVAMMSLSNGVVKMKIEDEKRILNVIKHPKVKPVSIEIPSTEIWEKKIYETKFWDKEFARKMVSVEQILKKFEVNIFWPNFAFWSSIIWDPRRFPKMIYDLWKEFALLGREALSFFPLYKRFFIKLLMPSNFNKIKNVKKFFKFFSRHMKLRGDCILEYLDDFSKTNEYYIRLDECRDCWGIENVGTPLALVIPAIIAGSCKIFDKEERDWNAIETKCIGLGDPYCEIKVVPGELSELRGFLEKDNSIIEGVYNHFMQHLMGFLLNNEPLIERPILGTNFIMAHPDIALPAMVGEKYRMALRMGGARAGKDVGNNLINAGITEDDAINRIVNFLVHCRIGKEISIDETIRIKENCESLYTIYYWSKWQEPSCFFTTGFLNGFFSIIKNQHVREIKCIAMGDPYCEWEFK